MKNGAHNRAKTHCPAGHPYDVANTYKTSAGSRSCRECARIRASIAPSNVRVERTRKWQAKNPDKVRLYDLRRRHRRGLKKYDLTPEGYTAMLNKQGGACAICRFSCSMGRRLSVDHCHTTGAVRGLLCGGCNVAIGRLKDDPALLKAAIAYLAVGPLS